MTEKFPSPQPGPVQTDAQILAAARALNKQCCAECGTDEEDSWKLYGNSYIVDAGLALRAAQALDLRDDVIATLRGQVADLQALCDDRGRRLYWADGQATAEGDALPPLPKPYQYAVTATAKNTPAVRAGFEQGGYEKTPNLYTAEQMQDFARAALASKTQPKGALPTAKEWTARRGEVWSDERMAGWDACVTAGGQALTSAPVSVPGGPEWLLPGDIALRISYEHRVTAGAVQAIAKAVHQLKAAQAPAPAPDMRDAYVGAREDLADWKRRALAAEKDTRRLDCLLNDFWFGGASEERREAIKQCLDEAELIAFLDEELAASPVAAAPSPAVGAGDARDAALDEAAALCEMWNTSPGRALAKEIRKLKAPAAPSKCDCTAYCGQYLLHGSCRAHPAVVTISQPPQAGLNVPVQKTGGE